MQQSDQQNLELLPLRDLVSLLATRDWRLRVAAETTLRRGGDTVIEALIWGLSQPEPAIRRWCAQILDHVADNRCVLALERLAHDPVARVRRAALHALSCQRCKEAPFDVEDVVARLLEHASADSSIRVRREAVYSLGLQPADPRAANALRRMLEEESDRALLRNARWALKQQNDSQQRSRLRGA